MHSRTTVFDFFSITTQLRLRILVCIMLCALLAACGFRLKGVSPLPFTTLYTNIAENTAFGANIRRAIVASSPQTRFVSDPQSAQARLTQLANRQTRRELSIDAEGHVEEYELSLEFIFQLTDAQGRMVLPPTTLRAFREVPYDPDDAQAKQDEINMIFQDMQQAMVARVVRRLSAPDVAEAFQKAQTQPAVDETLEQSDTPLLQTDRLDDGYLSPTPESSMPLN